MKEQIRSRAVELGFDACRFTSAQTPAGSDHFNAWLAEGRHGQMAYLARNAAKRGDPQLVLPGARSVVVLAASYFHPGTRGAFEPTQSGSGYVARYARYADYHALLGARLAELAKFVQDVGGPGTRCLEYVDTGPILERELAQRAGLGFVGKHTNLISRSSGNWIFLGEVLTTLALDPDDAEVNRCGHCTRCIEVCPTRAITAPFQLDARLCISYLTIELRGSIPRELRPAIGTRIFGCDDCLEVCPWNRFARAGRIMQSTARLDLEAPDLVALLELDETEFKARFRDTPLWRTKRTGLRRNVCVGLGNAGHARALPALRRAATDPDPIVAEHAQWAVERLAPPI